MENSVIWQSALTSLAIWGSLKITYPWLSRYLHTRKMLRPNYLGVEIPVAVGIVIPFTLLIVFPWIILEEFLGTYGLQWVSLLLMAYVGWKDDQLGGMEAKGLKGHLLLFMRKRTISTGMWKAIAASLVAIIVSSLNSSSVFQFLLHFLLIVLLTNLINLLDLRPGRALKGFFVLTGVIIASSYDAIPLLLWLPVAVTAMYLIRQDLKGMAMLGDAGANCLGMALGIWTVCYAPLVIKLTLAVFVFIVHIYAEKKSLTKLIQHTSFLHWLDMLGRREMENPKN